MKTVKITVWTSKLAALSMTPVTREYANEHAHDEDLERLLPEEGFPRDFFFCDGYEDGAVRLTVENGGKEQQFEKLPVVDWSEISEVSDEEERNGEFENEEAVRESLGDDSYVAAWKMLKPLRSSPLAGVIPNGDYFDFIQKDITFRDQCCDSGGDGIFFVKCGSMGKGEISFEIDLPDGEEFDMGKLHFLNCGEWWDREEFPCECQEAFQCQDVLLEYVEYDGRFIERQEPDLSFTPWKYIYCAKFSDAAFQELGEE